MNDNGNIKHSSKLWLLNKFDLLKVNCSTNSLKKTTKNKDKSK